MHPADGASGPATAWIWVRPVNSSQWQRYQMYEVPGDPGKYYQAYVQP